MSEAEARDFKNNQINIEQNEGASRKIIPRQIEVNINLY